MAFQDVQNPGIGGLAILTPAEEAFLTSLAGLAYVNGDILYYNSGSLQRLPIGTNTYVLTVSGGLPVWSASSGGGGGLTIGSTAIASGLAGGVLYDSGPGTLEENSNLVFDGTNLKVGGSVNAGGTTPSANTYFQATITGSLASGTIGYSTTLTKNGGASGTITGIRSNLALSAAITNFNMVGLSFNVSSAVSGAVLSNGFGFQGNISNVTGATFTTATGGYAGMVNQGTGTTWIGFQSELENIGTLTTLSGFKADILNIGGTITNRRGLDLSGWSNSGTISVSSGIYADTSLDSGTTHYFINSSSLSNSYMAGKLGLGQTTPTAQLHFAAGTATAGTAPIKLTTGTATTVAVDGQLEYDTSHLWFTVGTTRHQLDQQGGVTSVSGVTNQTTSTGGTTPAIGLDTSWVPTVLARFTAIDGLTGTTFTLYTVPTGFKLQIVGIAFRGISDSCNTAATFSAVNTGTGDSLNLMFSSDGIPATGSSNTWFTQFIVPHEDSGSISDEMVQQGDNLDITINPGTINRFTGTYITLEMDLVGYLVPI